MKSRDIGKEILDGLEESHNFKEGKLKLRTSELSEPSEPKIIRVRIPAIVNTDSG